MTINLKNIVVGGVLFYVVQFAIGLAMGPLIHEGVLDSYYMANAAFWRPELMQDPPDMAALMPRWIGVGLAMALLMAAIYDNIRSAFSGSGVVKGIKYGVMLGLISAAMMAGWSGVLNLPDAIWFWWAVEGFAYFIAGGAVLGWFIGKWGG
jgi:hypothetical protein